MYKLRASSFVGLNVALILASSVLVASTQPSGRLGAVKPEAAPHPSAPGDGNIESDRVALESSSGGGKASTREDGRWPEAFERMNSNVSSSLAAVADHAYFLQVFSVILVGVLGLSLPLIQIRSDRQVKDSLASWQRETKVVLQAEVLQKVEEIIEDLVERKYRAKLFAFVHQCTQQVLMQTPAARGLLLARLRSFDHQLEEVLRTINVEAASEVHSKLGEIIEDWHTLGQIFSTDEYQICLGLQTFLARPFREAESRIKDLVTLYKGDPEIRALAEMAEQTIRRM